MDIFHNNTTNLRADDSHSWCYSLADGITMYKDQRVITYLKGKRNTSYSIF